METVLWLVCEVALHKPQGALSWNLTQKSTKFSDTNDATVSISDLMVDFKCGIHFTYKLAVQLAIVVAMPPLSEPLVDLIYSHYKERSDTCSCANTAMNVSISMRRDGNRNK